MYICYNELFYTLEKQNKNWKSFETIPAKVKN